jgi:hypothetical protein
MKKMIFVLVILFACASEQEWKMPLAGQKYIHNKYEEVIESNTKFTKYKVGLLGDFMGQSKSAFITVKDSIVVAVYVGYHQEG